jgi:hypothetical protein
MALPLRHLSTKRQIAVCRYGCTGVSRPSTALTSTLRHLATKVYEMSGLGKQQGHEVAVGDGADGAVGARDFVKRRYAVSVDPRLIDRNGYRRTGMLAE